MKIKPGELHLQRQPSETSCGPTCLQAIYHYYGLSIDIHTIIQEVPHLPTGGTLAVHLGKNALDHGFQATIFTYNIAIFDPTWFHPRLLGKKELIQKLKDQKAAKKGPKLTSACDAYISYLNSGGNVVMEDLSPNLMVNFLTQKKPILTGLSSTYLYQASREYVSGDEQTTDDIRGTPEGHFVIIEKYDGRKELVTVADPFATNPFSGNLRYKVPLHRLVTALLLGVLTYDANFLVIEPSTVYKKTFK